MATQIPPSVTQLTTYEKTMATPLVQRSLQNTRKTTPFHEFFLRLNAVFKAWRRGAEHTQTEHCTRANALLERLLDFLSYRLLINGGTCRLCNALFTPADTFWPAGPWNSSSGHVPVSYTHLRAHETKATRD